MIVVTVGMEYALSPGMAHQHQADALREGISSGPVFGSVSEYSVKSYGPFKVGSTAKLGWPVRVLSLTNIPGGVSVCVEKLTHEPGTVNTWNDAACNLRPLPNTPEAEWYVAHGLGI